jgi:hypothetical protein
MRRRNGLRIRPQAHDDDHSQCRIENKMRGAYLLLAEASRECPSSRLVATEYSAGSNPQLSLDEYPQTMGFIVLGATRKSAFGPRMFTSGKPYMLADPVLHCSTQKVLEEVS